ncbi:SUKH-4 family immunity protein [Streptomyces sp. PSKA54]|uniref:SUKH-4 family immunity protein n=1 Tax=Streptomyces himalayensis subsp. aureolus TaxID=2758039 RepID=A0A7W2CWJ6_9ACTN|nr:SUKH-4 family immunity protein [Streptomyces himalayensis]MBA4860379.1 SUKH-4 family immunity protein [Streptomyces himalayensis subsp. aureolus]
MSKTVTTDVSRARRGAAGELRQLCGVFGAGEGDGIPLLWKIGPLVRPPVRIGGPGADLALDLPARLLDEEFGHGAVMRFEDFDFPRALTHEPTRRFLRDVGLPEDGFVLQLDTDVPLPTLAEYYADDGLGAPVRPRAWRHTPACPAEDALPERASELIRLGGLIDDADLVVDGATGEILMWSAPEATLRAVDADISTLAFALWLIHRERAADVAPA